MEPENSQPEYLTVATAGDEDEARVIEGLLIDAGIPVMIHPHTSREAFAFTIGDLATTEVMVPAERAEEAKAVIEAAATVTEEELTQEALNAPIDDQTASEL